MSHLYKISCLFVNIVLLGCNLPASKTPESTQINTTSEITDDTPAPADSLSTGYKVEDFSDYYYAIVEIHPEDVEEVFKRGPVTIYSMDTGKELIQVESHELAVTLQAGKVKANVKELPYGEQSIIICGDFNFDGLMDIAIQDGQYSCYHGPSYQIYLQGNNRELIHSPSFTRLAQEYCGMFDVDTENERLYTMTKSGCCWHQFSEFMVKNNVPDPVRVVEVDRFGEPYYATEMTIEEWGENGHARETITYLEDLREEDILFSFTMPHNGKTVYLLTIRDDQINYFIIDKDKQIELDFYDKVLNEDFKFYYNQKDEIYFQVIGADYTLYEKTDPDKGKQCGIRVKTGGKEYNYPADASTVTGSLITLGAYGNLIGPG